MPNFLKSLLGRASALLSPRVMLGVALLLLAAIGAQELRYQGLALVYQRHLTADAQAARQAAEDEARLRAMWAAALDAAEQRAAAERQARRAANEQLLARSRRIHDAEQAMPESLRMYLNGRLFGHPDAPAGGVVPAPAAVAPHAGAEADHTPAAAHDQRAGDAVDRRVRVMGGGGLVARRADPAGGGVVP